MGEAGRHDRQFEISNLLDVQRRPMGRLFYYRFVLAYLVQKSRVMTASEAKHYMAELAARYATSKTKKITAFNYWAQVHRVIDGDTLELIVDLGFNVSVKETFRLLGVDTPEKYGVKKTSAEYAKGVAATQFVEGMIPEDKWVEIEVYSGKKGKYGRWLCQVYVDGQSLNEALLIQGHAEPLPL